MGPPLHRRAVAGGPEPRAPRRRGLPPPGALLALLAVLSAAAALYAPALHYAFVFDDEAYLVKNAHVRYGLSAESVRWAFTAFHQGNWHPLTWLSHLADVELFNMDAGRHHILNVVLHLCNTALLFAVLRGLTGALWRSLLVAGLFALHPLRVESVAWVAERKDLLCAFFWLLGLLAWLGHLRRPSAARYLLTAALFAMGLMSKPMIVTFPFLLLVLDLWPLGRLSGRSAILPALREKAPLFLLSGAAVVVTALAQRSAGAVGSLGDYPAAARLATALTALTAYLRKMVWPLDLAAFYPNRGAGTPPAELALAAIVLAVITAAVWRRRGRGYPVAGWCWYLGTLVPVLGIVQVGDQALADRYTYLPLTGVFIVVAWGAGDLVGRSRLRATAASAAAVAALGLLAALSARQVRHWQDDVSLFGHAAAVVPDNWLAYSNLGAALAAQRRYPEALALYERALRIYPGHYQTLDNLGRLLSAVGRKAEAAATLERAIALHPELPSAYVNLGYLYVGLRDKEAARSVYRRLRRVDEEQAARLLLFVDTLP